MAYSILEWVLLGSSSKAYSHRPVLRADGWGVGVTRWSVSWRALFPCFLIFFVWHTVTVLFMCTFAPKGLRDSHYSMQEKSAPHPIFVSEILAKSMGSIGKLITWTYQRVAYLLSAIFSTICVAKWTFTLNYGLVEFGFWFVVLVPCQVTSKLYYHFEMEFILPFSKRVRCCDLTSACKLAFGETVFVQAMPR